MEIAGENPTAWLVIAAGDDREHAGNDGYDDAPSQHYSWDSTVANREGPQQGHVIVLRNTKVLLGVSVIDRVDKDTADKLRHRCPACSRANFKQRKELLPRYVCSSCKHEFDEPESRLEQVTTYRTDHAASWTDLHGVLTKQQLRDLCFSTGSQLSIRPFRYDAFRALLGERSDLPQLGLVEARVRAIAGGHRRAFVRVRNGQGAFRARLLKEYGDVCAFTGPTPREALEAAHLYSFAEDGEHRDEGGLLLRRDVHGLFDRGYLAVEPGGLTIDVVDALHGYEAYQALHGAVLQVELTAQQQDWVRAHWAAHR
ncbi:HNH endonuclease signature motif containing protein [Actinokineospora terrae]|uniref:HNH endonuclease n=1 Tax=Actinokineospora terrae TaxID=155974 RepID=A0A1H9L6B0_9PSEU|nr:HNH endonuclease signature motif containing protein [Actinokineospora terrae]SER07031.1 HNH endonuclease [Actinokineospora terrae]